MKFLKFDEVLIVIVLYKKILRESENFISLGKSVSCNCSGKVSLYIYDNSPEPQEIEPNKYFDMIYVHDSTNPGVSKAYNMACYEAKSLNKKWILIFDQDTELPLEAIKEYYKAISELEPEINIIAPKLFSGNKMISPCKYILHRGFPLSSTPAGKFQIKGHSFLNSGLLLKVCSIEKIGFFDENLFDYSDHDFIFRFATENKFAKIINMELKHDWSSAVDTNDDLTVNRFAMLARASRYMTKKYDSPFPMVWLIVRSLKLSFITKRSEYIKIVLTGDIYG
jgi:GT2 family glycosyltransferase